MELIYNNKTIYKLLWVIQLCILTFSLYLFTATLPFVPWYKDNIILREGIVYYLITGEIFIAVLYSVINRVKMEDKLHESIIIINIFVFCSTMAFSIINPRYVQLTAILYSFIEVLLIIIWIWLAKSNKLQLGQ